MTEEIESLREDVKESENLIEKVKAGAVDDSDNEIDETQNSFPESKEFILIEFPSGMKITLGSSLYTIYHLANLSLELLDRLKPADKLSEGYLG